MFVNTTWTRNGAWRSRKCSSFDWFCYRDYGSWSRSGWGCLPWSWWTRLSRKSWRAWAGQRRIDYYCSTHFADHHNNCSKKTKIIKTHYENLKSATHDCSSCLQETIQGAAAVDDGFLLPFIIFPASGVGGEHIWVRKSQPPPAALRGK